MKSFNEIIDFAIEREKSAIAFYRDLQDIARFKPQLQVLKEFEKMEEGHVVLLENVKKREVFEKTKAPKADLRLSDFLVVHPPAAEMTFQDILTAAIKKEERSMALYSRLTEESELAGAKDIFQRLYREESGHKHHFEVMYESEISPDN